jgi:uncharacterized protein (UPF0218 family)/phosphopantetheine adenylyltransferase
MGMRLEVCLVGGTFDRFHVGHAHLLANTLAAAELAEVWITSDEMARIKSPQIEPFDTRREAVLSWADSHADGRIKTFELKDSFGPALKRPDCDGIICTPETLSNCNEINVRRLANGLTPLEVIEVPHLLDDEGGVVSSTRIRAGSISRAGKSWLSSLDRTRDYLMKDELDPALKEPFGDLFTGPDNVCEIAMSSAIESIDGGLLVAVGDVTVSTLLGMEIIPDIVLVDGYTKRKELPTKVDLHVFDAVIHCNNPAGSLTASLILAINTALHSDGTVCIDVDGEEDLAPIIIHLLAPLGSNILYGQPGEGVVLAQTDEVMKERCRIILSKFEVKK